MKFALTPLLILGLVGSALFSPPAYSDGDDPVCAEQDPTLDKYQYLRSLSVALRGTPPTLEELESLHALADVPETMIDAMLDSEEFAKTVSRAHRTKLWNRIDNRSYYNRWGINGSPASGYHLSVVYRGGNGGCKDEPAQFTESGAIIAEWDEEAEQFREGYVMVEPYWAPGTEFKVCAYNAQTNLVSPNGTPCGTTESLGDPGCACGPNLQWCEFTHAININGKEGSIEEFIHESLSLALEKKIEHMLLEDRPYTDLFLDNTTYVNGPIVHMWRYFAQRGSYLDRYETLLPIALDVATLPDLAFHEIDTWVPVQLPAYHAGLFTSPAYLNRFTTNRRRARQFYEAFLCSPFLPPATGLEVEPESALETNLQERDGCNYCHKSLEPAAAYWGRWTSRGAGYLDPLLFPGYNEDCVSCKTSGSCSFDCNRHYLMSGFTTEESDYIGWLEAYLFLKEEHLDHVDYGPKLLFQKKILDGSIAHCAAKSAVRRLIGRDLAPHELPWIDELSAQFSGSGYQYKSLIKAIVTHPYFRRVL